MRELNIWLRVVYLAAFLWTLRIAIIFDLPQGNGARLVHRLMLWPVVFTWLTICVFSLTVVNFQHFTLAPALLTLWACWQIEHELKEKR